jgi:hypothetical protein
MCFIDARVIYLLFYCFWQLFASSESREKLFQALDTKSCNHRRLQHTLCSSFSSNHRRLLRMSRNSFSSYHRSLQHTLCFQFPSNPSNACYVRFLLITSAYCIRYIPRFLLIIGTNSTRYFPSFIPIMGAYCLRNIPLFLVIIGAYCACYVLCFFVSISLISSNTYPFDSNKTVFADSFASFHSDKCEH